MIIFFYYFFLLYAGLLCKFLLMQILVYIQTLLTYFFTSRNWWAGQPQVAETD